MDSEDVFDAIIDSIKEQALEVIKENPMLPTEASFAIKNIQSDSFLVNFVSSNMNLKIAEKQKCLNWCYKYTILMKIHLSLSAVVEGVLESKILRQFPIS